MDSKVLIRPEAATLTGERAAVNGLVGRLSELSFRGRYQVALIEVDFREETIGLKLAFDSTLEMPSVGEQVYFSLKPEEIIFLSSAHP